uniref:Ig-like domain-containing protein n=1 Tax=Amphilophus citrinellus TaxID=61819 RepID=A0A3Q0RZS5_AMPCI
IMQVCLNCVFLVLNILLNNLVGSSQPTVALVGDDIILPCYLDPSMNASDRTVEWTKHGLEPRFVYVWRDGGELESKKNPSYKGRTSLFIHKLKHGDVSLNLLRVKLSDRGRFRCFVPDIGETLIELVVGKKHLIFINERTRKATQYLVLLLSVIFYTLIFLFFLEHLGKKW